MVGFAGGKGHAGHVGKGKEQHVPCAQEECLCSFERGFGAPGLATPPDWAANVATAVKHIVDR